MISAQVVNVEKVVFEISAIPGSVREKLREAIKTSTFALMRKVSKDKLNGTILKNRTGRLMRSINPRFTDFADGLDGAVGTNVKYAAAHEYGFSGLVTVKAHLRMIKTVFGRSVSPHQISIRSHDRRANLPERSFLRSSLKEMTPEILAALDAAVAQGIKR